MSSLQSTTVTDSQTTVAAVTVPGDGDYALAFSAVFLNPDSTGTVVACGMEVDTTGTKEVIATPATADTLVDEFSNVTASAVGVVRLSDAESATLTMACQLDPGANSNTVTAGWVHFMATRVGTVTDESPI